MDGLAQQLANSFAGFL